MKLLQIIHRKKIAHIEALVDKIYHDTMLIDERFCSSNGKIRSNGMITTTRDELNKLWELYWELAEYADDLKVKYVGMGKSTLVTTALNHLIFECISVFNKKMDIDILSSSWKNFYIYHHTDNPFESYAPS
jgi:hypothetical protein